MFKILRLNYSTITQHTNNSLAEAIEKLKSLPMSINTDYFDTKTLSRLNLCSNEYLTNLFKSLIDYDIKEKQIALTLKNHEDWSLLTRENIAKTRETFRALSIQAELYSSIFASNSQIIQLDEKALAQRFEDLKEFFTKNQLRKILLYSPDILTSNLDYIRYKFSYVYFLMGIEQDEMRLSNFLSHSIDHIRERHLFLERAALFDKPNKKGETKVENPRLFHIVDLNLKEYLKVCTRNLFKEGDYKTFCDYLKEEKFDNELLGTRMGKQTRNNIIKNIQLEKKSRDEDGEE